MKVYIEYESAIEAKSLKPRILPKTSKGEVTSVAIIIPGKPNIQIGIPSQVEIAQMQQFISQQYKHYEELNKAFERIYNLIPEKERQPKDFYFISQLSENANAN